MTVPVTDILDDFNRADESPLSGGGAWNTEARSSDKQIRLVGNQIAHPDGVGNQATRVRADTLTAPFELYVEVPVATVAASQGVGIDYCLANLDGASVLDGYRWQNLAGVLQLYRIANAAFTKIGGDYAISLSDGDWLAVRLLANGDHELYHGTDPVAGLSLVAVVNDATRLTGQYGLMISTVSAVRLDNFGGGALTSEGAKFPGTVASLANAGSSENANAWTSPTNVGADDGTNASITASTYDSPDISEILVASNFGFTIPSDATIDGILVEIERNNAAGAASDNRVQLAKGTTFANLVGDNKADTTLDWPASMTRKSYGASSDLWGTTWTPAEINASSFAVMLSVQADAANTDIAVDYIKVTVFYEAADGTNHTVFPEDTITLSDTAGKAVAQTKTDTVTLSDATSRVWSALKSFGDTVTLSDARAKSMGLPRADTLTLTDNMVAQIILILQLSDTITLSDATAKAVGKTRADTLTLSDQLTRAWAARRAQADTLTLADAVGKSIKQALADTISSSDALGKADKISRADAISLADAIARAEGLSKADTLTLTDALVRGVTIPRSDTLVLTDAQGKTFGLLRADSITLSDFADVVLTVDDPGQKELADTIVLADDFILALNGQFITGDGARLRTILLNRFGIY